MSARGICKTEFDDCDILADAVNAIYGKSAATVGNGLISINANGVRCSYKRVGKDGRYELVYDKDYTSALKDLLPQTKSDGTVVYKVAQEYSRIKVGNALKTIKGLKIVKTSQNDTSVSIEARIRQ